MKRCKVCESLKDLSEFHRRRSASDGRQDRCKTCISAYMRSHYERNADRIKVAVSEYRASNPAIVRESMLRTRARRGDKKREEDRRWRANNPDRVRAHAARYRQGHREEQAQYARIRRVRRAGVTVYDFTPDQWAALKVQFDNRCAYCGRVATLEQDHVVPISRGGQHTASNIVPSCKPCNSRKKDRLLSEVSL